MPTPQKEAVVEELTNEFRDAKRLLFADYRGLDVEAITELRSRCREQQVRFLVAKNTLSRRAMSAIGVEDVGSLLEGPTGLAIAKEDQIAAARVLVGFSKENEKLEIKGGVMEGRVYSLEEVKALASLPSRDELIAQVLAAIQSPVVFVAGILQNLLRDVVSCAEQHAEKGGGAPAAEEAAGGDVAAEAEAASDEAAPEQSQEPEQSEQSGESEQSKDSAES